MKNLIIATLIFAAPFCIAAETPWQTKNGDVLDVFTNGVVLRTFTTRAHARPEPYYVNSMQRKGGFFGPLAPTESILALNSPEKIAGPIIFIKNVSEHKKVEPPGEIAWRVRKTGETILWKGKELECWEEKAELPEAAAKRAEQERENEAVQQESERRAREGIRDKAAEEFYLGMCYLNGTDILKKDEAEAKRYFKAAAKKGHLGAAAKLKAIETEVP